MLKLSKNIISSFEGDILSLYAESDAEEIRCTPSDASVVRLRELGKGKYLVILEKVGTTSVTVEAGDERAVCEIRVREAKKSDPDGKFKIYVGDTHAHTSYSDGMATPYEVFQKVSEEEYFHFFTITDHTELEDDDEFFHTFDAADRYQSEEFTAFAGSESQLDLYSENSIGRSQNDGGEIVVINKEGYSYSDSWDKFFRDIGENKTGFAIIAHPQILGYTSTPLLWNAFDPEHNTSEKTLDLIHGVETLNETDDSNMINERAYSLFLDCGYKVAPIAASDHHGPRWGKVAQTCRTFVYSQGMSKDLFIDAMRSARAYSCENGNVKLFYTVNGKNPATTLPLTDTYEFQIHAEPFYLRKYDDETVYAEIISDYGEVVAARDVGKYMFDFDMTVKSTTARYFYLKLYSRIGEVTWSAPIWTGREFDPCPKPKFTKQAQNDELFRVKSFSGGKNGFSIINTNTADYCQLNDVNGEITIDMGKVRTVSAVGYFPNQPTRGDENTYACFVSRYEYYVSMNGLDFTRVASGRIRLYGCEHITEFAPVEARYIKLRTLSTVGSEMRKERFRNIGAAIGALRVY